MNMEYTLSSYKKDIKEIKKVVNKLGITAENFFALILVLKTISFVKAVFLYLGM